MDCLVGLRFYVIYISAVYAIHSLARDELQPQRDSWLTGYKILFVVAAVKSLLSYTHLRLFSLSEQAKKLQFATLATTGNGDELALSREDRFSKTVDTDTRRTARGCDYKNHVVFTPYDRSNPAPVFWSSFAIVLLVYNTIHLALTPSTHVTPLFFGTPAFVGYWGVVRLLQILLH